MFLTSASTSFNNLNKWIDNVREVRGEEALIMIIANKVDLENERDIEKSVIEQKMKDIGCSYMEVSAKTGHNVKEFFRELAFVIAGESKAKDK